MKWRYFLFQLKAFLVNPKNIGLFIATVIMSLYFSLVSVPNRQVIEQVDAKPIRKEYIDDTAFLKVAMQEIAYSKKPGYYSIPSKGAVDAVSTYPQVLSYDKKILLAIKKKDWDAYAKNASARYQYIDELIFVEGNQNFLYPAAYNQNDNFKQDGHFGYQRTYHLYNALLAGKKDKQTELNKNILEERTALQVIQNSLSGWTVLIMVVIVCFFAADIVTNDRKYYTVLENIPLSKRTILWLKTGVVEVGALLDFVVAGIIALLCIAPRYGLGSLRLNTVDYLGKINFKATFRTETLGMYYLQFIIFAIIISFIFIRLTILLSIVLRNEYVAGMLSSLFAISAKMLYFSLGMGFVYPFLEKWPMTYFSIGDSITGNLAYLMDAPGWGFTAGLGPLICLALVIEILLFLFTQIKSIPLVRRGD